MDADVKIILSAEDRASAEVETATQRINKQYRELRLEQRAVRGEFELNNRTFVATTRVLNSLGTIVGRAISLWNTYLLSQIRTQDATRNLRDAQADLNEVIAEFGPNSNEYVKALEREKEAQEDLERANRDNLITYGLIAAQLITMIGHSTTLIGRLRILQRIGLGGPKPLPAVSANPTAGIKGSAGGGLKGKIGKAFKSPKIPGVVGGIAGGAASAGLFLAQMAGEQTAGGGEGGELPSGLEAIGPALEAGGRAINNVTNNILINAPTAEDIINEIKKIFDTSNTFGQGG